jgi:hypothetical protein
VSKWYRTNNFILFFFFIEALINNETGAYLYSISYFTNRLRPAHMTVFVKFRENYRPYKEYVSCVVVKNKTIFVLMSLPCPTFCELGSYGQSFTYLRL